MRYLLALLLVVGCANKRVITDDLQKHSEINLESKLLWVKIKSKKIDFEVEVTNNGKTPILIEANAFSSELEGVKSVRAINRNEGDYLSEGDVFRYLITTKQLNSPLKHGKGKITFKKLFTYENDKKGKALAPIVHEFEF